jgi:hypothetical protein
MWGHKLVASGVDGSQQEEIGCRGYVLHHGTHEFDWQIIHGSGLRETEIVGTHGGSFGGWFHLRFLYDGCLH